MVNNKNVNKLISSKKVGHITGNSSHSVLSKGFGINDFL
jgi:hypothetical protein